MGLNSDRKRFEGVFFKLRLTAKAKKAHSLYTAHIVLLMRAFFIAPPVRDMSSFHSCILLSATVLIRNFNDRGFYDRGAFGKKLLASNFAENWLKIWRSNPFPLPENHRNSCVDWVAMDPLGHLGVLSSRTKKFRVMPRPALTLLTSIRGPAGIFLQALHARPDQFGALKRLQTQLGLSRDRGYQSQSGEGNSF